MAKGASLWQGDGPASRHLGPAPQSQCTPACPGASSLGVRTARSMPRILFASLPLRLMMPADRVAAAAQGVKELVFRTLPSANKVSRRVLRCAVRAVRPFACVLSPESAPASLRSRSSACWSACTACRWRA